MNAALNARIRRGAAPPKPVLRRLLLPLMSIMSLLMVGAGLLFWQQHRLQLEEEIAADATDAAGDLRVALAQQAASLNATAHAIAADRAAMQALRRGDADRLLAAWQPVYEAVRRDRQLAQLSFLDTNRVCLLSVHNPKQRGERIDRFTAIEAERTGRIASGIEVMPLGGLSLRAVLPLFEGATRVGYVEVGAEIEDTLRLLHTRSGNQLAVTICGELPGPRGGTPGTDRPGSGVNPDCAPPCTVIYATQGRQTTAIATAAGLHQPQAMRREVSSGGRVWRVSSTALKDASGAPVGALLTMSDITADKAAFARTMAWSGTAGSVLLALLLSFIYVLLRRTDAGIASQRDELLATESRFRNLVAQSPLGIQILDAGGRTILVNRAFEDLWGVRYEQMRNHQIREDAQLNLLGALPYVEQAFAGAVTLFPPMEITTNGETTGGPTRVVRAIAYPIKDATGAVREVTLMYQDVTAQAHADTALRRSEDHYRQLIENVHDIIYTLDLDGVFTFVSPSWTTHLGHPTHAAMGHRIHEFIHPDDLPACLAFLQSVVETGQRSEGIEYRVRHLDGSWRWHTSSAVPLRTDAGAIVRIEGIARDITERKLVETGRDLASAILRVLNEPGPLQSAILRIPAAIQARTGFEAVGLRLCAGDDVPYAAQVGFPAEFLATENALVERGKDGGVCQDCSGRPCWEGSCGQVLSGKAAPQNPNCTPGGSFWTNDSFPLLDLPPDQDPRLHPRNQCIHHGYASVALVPIRVNDQILGLLQLNDHRPASFTLGLIEQLESAAVLLGEALVRRRAEERVRTLLEESTQARLALLGILEDETRAQVELKRLATAVEQAAEIFIVTNAQGRIEYVNPAFEAVTGYTRAEAVGQSPRFLQSGQHDEAFYRELWETIGGGKVWEGRLVNRKKSGVLYTEEATISPVRDQIGTIVNYVAVKRDLTEHLGLQAQLLQAQKMESIGTLAGGVAHEINNPIMGIMGYTELISDHLGPDSPAAPFAVEIIREVERVATIVRNLLAFARQETPVFSPARLCEIVDATSSLIRALIRRDQITLNVEIPTNLPMLWCRGQQIQQVVMNLLTNARDALNEKYPAYDENKMVLITARVITPRKASGAPPVAGEPVAPARAEVAWVRLTIEDHGRGIPESVRARMFDPFFTTKPRDKGTGLGLSITHGIVKDHGGEITVETVLGQWTRFHVDLPVDGGGYARGQEEA